MGGPRVTIKKFIDRAKSIHKEKYDYTKSVYQTYHKKLIITCKIHGDFAQSPAHHLAGKGCKKCMSITLRKAFAETNESFIAKAKKIHGDEYNYSKINYVNQKIKIVIICKKHGDFLQQPSNHLLGKGCLKCGRVESVGERKVKKWLKENNIDFEQEKKFASLIGKKNSNYRFDFYLPKYNLLIEYDGVQHFILNEKSSYFKYDQKKFNDLQANDQIKNDWAKQNKYKLLRIPYNQIKDIDQILTNSLLKESNGSNP